MYDRFSRHEELDYLDGELPEFSTRQRVSPGKRSLTMNVPRRAHSTSAPVQRWRDPAAAPAQMKRAAAPIQPAADTAMWMDAAVRPDLHSAPLQRKRSGTTTSGDNLPADGAGKAMPENVQAKMEGAFGTDFSSVRIHEGPRSRALGARAYTQGTNIHFAPGQYQPNSPTGQALLGHELTHVVQQSQGRVGATMQKKGLGVNDDTGLEREADEMGAKAARGEHLVNAGPLTSVQHSGTARLQLSPDPALSDQVIQRDAPADDSGGTTINKDQELEIDLGGGKKIKITGKSLQGSVALDEMKFPKEDFEKSHRFEPLQFCPGVYGYIAVSCSAGVVDNATVTVVGTKTGDGEDATWSLAVSGENVIKGEAKASMSLGIAAGLPGIANLSAEAAAIPTAVLENRHGITGALTWSKSAGVGGYVEFPMKVNAALELELALRLMYEVFWKDHPTEFAKYTVGKWEIATASMEGTPRYTIGQGLSADVIPPTIKWGGKPKPTHIAGRPAAEQVSEYERRKAEYDRNTAGTGGGPGYHPDDDRPDEGNVLVDDGAGVNELKPAETPAASADGGGGMTMAPDEGGQSIDPMAGGECTEEDPDGDGVPG